MLKNAIFITIILFLCAASTCPTKEGYLPDRLPAPEIINKNVTGINVGGKLQEVIRISWSLSSDSLSEVSSFVILRTHGKQNDSNFSVLVHSIAPNINVFYDKILNLNYDGSTYKQIFYKIYAIDNFSRPGDTSEIDTFTLAPQATIKSPKDTLKSPLLKWSIQGIIDPYRTKCILYKNYLPIWESQLTNFMYKGENTDTTYIGSIPDSLLPLESGYYAFGAFINVIIAGLNPESIKINRFYVP